MKVSGYLVAVLCLVSLSHAGDYCSICSYHTMCDTTNSGDKCVSHTQASLTPDEKQLVLNEHNKLRNKIAMGLESLGAPGPMPSAANMMKMEWDDELATIAQRLADQCVWGHDCDACRQTIDKRFSIGQNIGKRSTLDKQNSLNFTGLADAWYTKEVEQMNNSYVNSYKFGKWGHFSQIVWWNSRLVGCGASLYVDDNNNIQHLVCNYGSTGNIPDAKIYEQGAPASKCPTGTAKDSTYPGLCAIQNMPTDGKFATDNVLLGYPPYVMLSDPTCSPEGFRAV